MAKTVSQKGFLLRMHPLQRIALSIIFASAVLFFIRNLQQGILFHVIATWAAFAFSYVLSSWIIIFFRKIEDIKAIAAKEDGSRLFVLFFTILSSFAAMVAVLLLVISSGKDLKNEIITVIVSFFAVIVSWVLVHTILAFHYAHLYYADDRKEKKANKGGIDFPGDEEPDYLDFAYFSFVIGMTFQVSDVEVTGKRMRRLVLAHGLISFLLNTFVVALTVNFIAGLSK